VVDYLTDGVRLYEIAAQRTDPNFGLTGGVIRQTVIRDCVSEETRLIDDLFRLALREVAAR
jgi:hypothetical protein